jgi:hypothetical protein
LTAAALAANGAYGQEKIDQPTPRIQVAILLDTSNSMDGLIDQAKSQLWKIVNELSMARKQGLAPQLQVALYEYGKDTLPSDWGYMRMVAPLTTDLDLVSQELFDLRTSGGVEHCGQAIQEAATHLAWSRQADDLRIIFIAGNEEFTQGPVKYQQACAGAKGKGILVNTIFCGSYQEGERIDWKDGADLAGGKYTNIDQEQKPLAVDAPQDGEIAELNLEMNNTFLAWGGGDKGGKVRQLEQDQNASSYSKQMMAERTMAKATAQYTAPWDLVDAVRSGRTDLGKIEDAKLPFVLRGKTPKAKRAYIDEQAQKRAAIAESIRKLYLARQRFTAQKYGGKMPGNTLDVAVIEAIREQAKAKGFSFE